MTDTPINLAPDVIIWQNELRRLLEQGDGETPDTPRPPVRPGVTVHSATQYWNDGNGPGGDPGRVHGIVIGHLMTTDPDAGEFFDGWQVVTQHHGRIGTALIADDDVLDADDGILLYTGIPNRTTIAALLVRVAEEAARRTRQSKGRDRSLTYTVRRLEDLLVELEQGEPNG